MTEKSSHYPCPACGSDNTTAVLEAKDYTVSGEMFTINECHACTLRFTFPVPDEGHIAPYYQSKDYISHSDTNAGVINKLYHTIRRFSLRQKKRWIKSATALSTGNILDIGCGTGSFLHVMRQAGWMVTGIEPDEQAREVARHKYQLFPLSPEGLYQLPSHSFHAITLWHVLEHVHNLHEYLERMHQLLRPQGKLFMAVPNYTSPDAEKYKASWAAYDVPRHLYHFSPKALTALAEKHHFQLVGQIAMPYDAFYISLLSEKYLHGKTHYRGGLLTGLRSWLYARKNSSKASSILYILQP